MLCFYIQLRKCTSWAKCCFVHLKQGILYFSSFQFPPWFISSLITEVIAGRTNATLFMTLSVFIFDPCVWEIFLFLLLLIYFYLLWNGYLELFLRLEARLEIHGRLLTLTFMFLTQNHGELVWRYWIFFFLFLLVRSCNNFCLRGFRL